MRFSDLPPKKRFSRQEQSFEGSCAPREVRIVPNADRGGYGLRAYGHWKAGEVLAKLEGATTILEAVQYRARHSGKVPDDAFIWDVFDYGMMGPGYVNNGFDSPNTVWWCDDEAGVTYTEFAGGSLTKDSDVWRC